MTYYPVPHDSCPGDGLALAYGTQPLSDVQRRRASSGGALQSLEWMPEGAGAGAGAGQVGGSEAGTGYSPSASPSRSSSLPPPSPFSPPPVTPPYRGERPLSPSMSQGEVLSEDKASVLEQLRAMTHNYAEQVCVCVWGGGGGGGQLLFRVIAMQNRCVCGGRGHQPHNLPACLHTYTHTRAHAVTHTRMHTHDMHAHTY